MPKNSSKSASKPAVKQGAKQVVKASARAATPAVKSKDKVKSARVVSAVGKKKPAEKSAGSKAEKSKSAALSDKGLVTERTAKLSTGKKEKVQKLEVSNSVPVDQKPASLSALGYGVSSEPDGVVAGKTKGKTKKAPKPPKEKKLTAAEKASAEENLKWAELKEKFSKEKAVSYTMTANYEPLQPLIHKVLGWGYILSNNNDRLEVLFESGKKVLISNYQQK